MELILSRCSSVFMSWLNLKMLYARCTRAHFTDASSHSNQLTTAHAPHLKQSHAAHPKQPTQFTQPTRNSSTKLTQSSRSPRSSLEALPPSHPKHFRIARSKQLTQSTYMMLHSSADADHTARSYNPLIPTDCIDTSNLLTEKQALKPM